VAAATSFRYKQVQTFIVQYILMLLWRTLWEIATQFYARTRSSTYEPLVLEIPNQQTTLPPILPITVNDTTITETALAPFMTAKTDDPLTPFNSSENVHKKVEEVGRKHPSVSGGKEHNESISPKDTDA
jgi:hypothetical protein